MSRGLRAFFAKRSRIRDYLLILAGTFLMSVAINLIYEPMELITGGVTGLGIIIKHFTGRIIEGGVPVWATNLIFNIPVFAISLKVFGFRYISKTLFATLSLSGFLAVLPIFSLFESDYILSVIFRFLDRKVPMNFLVYLFLLILFVKEESKHYPILLKHTNYHFHQL